MDAARGGAHAAVGLPAGAASRPFSRTDFQRELLRPSSTVYVWAAGAVLVPAGGGGGARAAAAARLAPHVPARTAELRLLPPCAPPSPTAELRLLPPCVPPYPAAAPRLQLALATPLAPHEELRLWPAADLLRQAGVPVLAPHHIRGSADYRCDCGARFDQPNPLKVHLYLGCDEGGTERDFWLRLLERLGGEGAGVGRGEGEPTQWWLDSAKLTPSWLDSSELALSWVGGCEPPARGTGHTRGHACLYCGKLYSRRYGLKIHVRTHTGHKPLRCPHCARRFADPSNLNKHVRLHAGGGGGGGARRPPEPPRPG